MNQNRDQLGLKCSVLISDFNDWTCRNNYIKVIEDYLNDRINFKEFENEFLNIWSTNNNKTKSWEEFIFIINNFKLNQFDGFSSLTARLFEYIDIVESDLTFKQNYEITEEQLKGKIKVILSKMKYYCRKIS